MGGKISLEMILYFISLSFKLMLMCDKGFDGHVINQCVTNSIPFQCSTCGYIPVKSVLKLVSSNW